MNTTNSRYLIVNKVLTTASLCMAILLLSNSTFAQEVNVASIADLQAAINKAKPGSVIILADGVYPTTDNINVGIKGEKGKPVTLKAQHTGKAEITGKGGFNLVSPAA